MRTRRLIVATPEGERELLFIGRLTVGRAPECDISVADTKISRRHAEFDASGPVPRVTDLGSRNGILVNGRKVGAADLTPGDVVTVGDARIRFEERVTESVDLGAQSATDDRTAVLPAVSGVPPAPPVVPSPAPVPSAVAEPVADLPLASPPPAPVTDPPPAALPPAIAAAAALAGDPDKTSVLPRQTAAPPPPAAPSVPPALAEASDKTMVLPAPSRPAPPVAPPPVAVDLQVDGRHDLADRPASPSSPPRVAPAAPPPVAAAPPVAAPPPIAVAPPVVAAPPVAVAPPAVAVDLQVDGQVAGRAAPPSTGAAGNAVVSGGPKFSWGGLVTLAAVVLGGLAVLLGALPLMSASASTIDALSQRQARTLAGWLAAGVQPGATPVVDSEVLSAVLAQPGVERALVVERASGRAVAPSSQVGQAVGVLPGVGEGWRDLGAPQVGRNDGFADAYVPVGGGAYVVWVRYARPASSDTGLAVIVALIAMLVLAMLVAMMIKRHTRATLQHFTRQVELAVSGASPKVMQGTLMPGLERLPGVVTYLLERRTALDGGARPSGSASHSSPDALELDAAPIDPGPPWIEVTPSLMVATASAHPPQGGAPGWADAQGRHLLDVLDNGPTRNAVVQGLGALGMQAGAEASATAADGTVIALRREASGHVRVTLGAR